MIRLKTYDTTGVAPNGVLFAGDMNALEDAVAAVADLTQHIDLASVSVGESGLQLVRYGAGELRVTGRARTDGYVLALGGIMPGAFTTTARDAIPAGQRPTNLVIRNTTTGSFQYNSGSDAVPNWADLGASLPTDIVARAGTIMATRIGDAFGGTGGLNVNGDTWLYRAGAANWIASGSITAPTLLIANGGGTNTVMMGNRSPSLNLPGISFRSDSAVLLYAVDAFQLRLNVALVVDGGATFGNGIQAPGVSANSFFHIPGTGLTIVGNAITVTNTVHRIVTAGMNLSTINGGVDGREVIIVNKTGGVISYDTAGNIASASAIANENLKTFIYLTNDNKWHPTN